MIVLEVMEIIGIIAFSAAGALISIRHSYDIFGVVTMSVITASGGGIIRDIILQRLPLIFTNYIYVGIMIATSMLVMLLYKKLRKIQLLVWLDVTGLAAFTILAGLMAYELGLNFLTFCFISCISGVGGGLIRDIIIKRKHMIFEQEIYAVASLIGIIFFFVLSRFPQHVSLQISAYISAVVIIIIRMLSKKFNLHLPKVKID